MANLSITELKRRDGRIETLVGKLSKNDSFQTTKGNVNANVLVQFKGKKFHASFFPYKSSQEIQKAINILRNSSGQDVFFISDAKNSFAVPITQLVKTGEFGGKEGGSLAVEERAIITLRDEIIKAVKKNKGPINIKLKNKIVSNIVDVEKTSGTPKSDFHLLDSNGNAVVWISHKDGSRPRDFQQWGGISQRVEPEIFQQAETQKFINDLKKRFPDGLPPATTLYRKIKDTKLKMLSVYGNQYGKQQGTQNVSVLLQGPPGLSQSGSVFTLTANHVHYNGEIVDSGGFEPVLMAVFKGDRSDAGIKGTRLSISPIESRKGVEFP